jgi:DNA-binding transcriptional MerR regulator
MLYTMADLEARSGVSARTIRDYIRSKFVEPPRGHGPGATYTEEQLLRVTLIARLRARKTGWDIIGDRLGSWSLQKMRAFVRQTDPPAPPSAAPAQEPAVEGEPVAPAEAPRHPEADTTTELDVTPDRREGELPGGAHFVMAPVLPGLALLLRHDAAPLVKRIAREILEKYAATM